MPRRIASTELEALIEVVGRFPEGASIDEIARAPEIDLSRRTLQRRLAALVENARLVLEGRGRGSRYRVSRSVVLEAEPVTLSLHMTSSPVEVEVGIPLSPEGTYVKRLVRAPIHDRRPVGYERTFLRTHDPSPGSRSWAQCRTGTDAAVARCAKQPMFAVAIASGSCAWRFSILRDSSSRDSSGCSME